MTPQSVLTFAREALSLLLMVSLPVLLTVMVVGLVVSIFQAVTQINENTLSFVPKMIAAVIVFLVAGPWMISIVVDFIRRTFENIPMALG
ncbi:flagellar biosynthesis protein FliQ [Comamonas nitrativorans]|uniref:Flagellar biosynthetic protein FliQ n=1 Tax=Comamonas nitrativorans TaxID=108437 RepID=A0ABV9GX74_9BURK